MNNLYHKVAVASVCTVLGFAVGASSEAKAATFTFVPLTNLASPSILMVYTIRLLLKSLL